VRVERYVPQSLLLPQCDAVVCHGGYSTVLASLCHGLPMVLTPLGADQPLHAGRCQDLGVALVVDRGELAPARMREAIRQILADPGYTDRARALREEMTQLPGIDQAVRLLEQLAANG
jgi:UDP:flavonoid glycosyltransferase YjiC (YdhE family)